MTIAANTRILLTARPYGPRRPNDFRIEDAPIPEPAEGQILLRVLYLSLDPYMRGHMSAAKSYAAPVGIGAVMEGGTVARVEKSRHPEYAEGDILLPNRAGDDGGALSAAELVSTAWLARCRLAPVIDQAL